MKSSEKRRLLKRAEDPDYRRVYFESYIDTSIAAQIKANREDRAMSQEQLAKAAGLFQSQVSKMEDVNHSGWTAKTLRKIARALDVALIIRFERFSKALAARQDFPRTLVEPPYDSLQGSIPRVESGRGLRHRHPLEPIRGRGKVEAMASINDTATDLQSFVAAAERYDAVMSRVGLVVAQIKGGSLIITECSQSVDALAGEPLDGHRVRDHVPPDLLPRHDAGVTNTTGEYFSRWHDFEFLRSDGTLIPIRLRVFAPTRDGYYVAEMETR